MGCRYIPYGELAIVLCVLVGCGDGEGSGDPDAATADAAADAALIVPDLRFHWVGAQSAFHQNEVTNVFYGSGAGVELHHTPPSEYSWSPLQLTLTGLISGSYSWEIADFTPVQGVEPMLSVARSGPIANLDTDLAPHAEEVIVSLDILPDAYAFVTNGVAAGSPAYQRNPVDVSRESLDAWVASEGAAGRVVTALSASPTAGLIRAYSHARDGDSTSYETAVVDASSATLIDSATTLGADGYIITGFGRVGDDGTVLVGTRPPGAAARTVSVQMVRPDPPDLQAGDAIVAWIFQDPEDIMILQR